MARLRGTLARGSSSFKLRASPVSSRRAPRFCSRRQKANTSIDDGGLAGGEHFEDWAQRSLSLRERQEIQELLRRETRKVVASPMGGDRLAGGRRRDPRLRDVQCGDGKCGRPRAGASLSRGPGLVLPARSLSLECFMLALSRPCAELARRAVGPFGPGERSEQRAADVVLKSAGRRERSSSASSHRYRALELKARPELDRRKPAVQAIDAVGNAGAIATQERFV